MPLKNFNLNGKMPFDPSEYEVLRITNKKSPNTHTYFIIEYPIKEVQPPNTLE